MSLVNDVSPALRRFDLFDARSGAVIARNLGGLTDELCNAEPFTVQATETLQDLQDRGKPADADADFPDIGDISCIHPHNARIGEAACTEDTIFVRTA